MRELDVAVASLRPSRVVRRKVRRDTFRKAAHDMRTPLAVVTQGIEALLEFDDETQDGAQRLFNIVRRNVVLMGEMLAASADGVSPSARPKTDVDLEALARDVADLMKPVLDARGQSIAFRITGRPIRTRGDFGGLARVVLNLLDNASKYGPAGDSLLVRMRHQRTITVMSIHDHGPGIPEGDRRAIFRAFYRSAAARRSGVEGMGLGLSVVRQIIAQHGGSVGVSCGHGETRVWFCVPNSATASLDA